MSYVLETSDLTKVFSGKEAVSHVSLKVKKGDIYGFIGENGAGKTTLIRMAAGLASPTSGTLRLFDSDDLVSQRNNIGTVIESPALYPNLSAEQNLIVQCKLIGVNEADVPAKTLELVGLADTGKKKAKNFSLGMKQRLAIAIALIGDPEFLILDEPTNGLDPMGIKEIRELILRLNKERGITVLISSHILGELSKLATRYGIIHKGVLIEEFTDQELWERCRTCLVIEVEPKDMDKAKVLLETELGTKNYTVRQPNIILLNDYIEEAGKVNQILSKNDIMVDSISVEHADLEEYFVRTIGGLKR